MHIAQIETGGGALRVQWEDGAETAFLYLWLCDNAPDVRTANGQRLIESLSIPDDAAPESVALEADGAVTLVWAHDGTTSRFPAAWLREHAFPAVPPAPARTLWDASFQPSMPETRHAALIEDPRALHAWLRAVAAFGFAVLREAPVTPGTVLDVVSLFGYVRETNYGRLFDVRSVVSPNNLAFTGLPLSVHTDNPYRDPVPTLQLLHCLASDVQGGDSILADGFWAAEALRRQSPTDFDLLASQPVRFHFRDETTDLSAEVPIIRLDARGQVVGIRFNNRSIAPFDFPPARVAAYYRAYCAFARLLNDPRCQIRFKMEPGDLFIVDNERVLHGRTGFSSSGARHLQGCYADRDGLISRMNVLERTLGGSLEHH